jgi:RNA polymerase sigma factor (sigma-70 family)
MEAMTSAADREWAGVIESAASGDDVAFGRLVAAYNDDMRRVCIVVCRDEALAEDAVQAAWAIAWQKLASVREPARVKPWLIAIAANKARDQLRLRRRRSEVEWRGRAPSVDGGIDPATGIDSLDMLAAIERLDPQDRALLAMRYVAGFDAAELSLALGISPAGTRTRLKRLIDRLKGELGHG